MTRFWQLSLLLLTCIGVNFISPPCAYACSCAPPPSPQVARDKATAVFVGKVLAMQAATGEIVSSGDPEQITFQVTRVWKGPVYTQLVVTTARESATCGFPFELNEEYLVYTTGSEKALETSLCSRTLPLTELETQQDFDILGQPQVPTSAPPAELLPSPILSPTVSLLPSPILSPTVSPTASIMQPEIGSRSVLPIVQIGLIALASLGLIIGVALARRK